MRTVHRRSLLFAALAVLTLVASGTAQERSSGLLNALEVRQLVGSTGPADNARLAVHFSVLADRYTAEATRHLSMSQSFVGNPSRNLGSGMSAHCRRLADLNTQEAKTVRELVAYHEKLAAATPATPPRDAARFQAGAGAPEPTEKELSALAAKAGTPAEHRALAEYFETLARRYEGDAREHSAFASGLRGTRIEHAATIHGRLAALAREAAKEATAAAEMHKGLAVIAR
jgi:hypothetical protein